MKKIIKISIWCILSAGLIVMLGFVEKQHQLLTCSNLDILIKYNSDDYFFITDDIYNFLIKKGYKIKGSPLSNINAGEIENVLKTNPYIEKADVYISIDGDVKINIIHKKPIVKVFNKYDKSFYIDDKGNLIPPSDKYSARLLVANGFINDFYSPYIKLNVKDSTSADSTIMKTSIYKVYKIAEFINKNDFWKAMIEEIFINKKGELELFTKIGDQSVIFGDIDNMKEKFDNLFIFYKQALNKIGWKKYKTINLKYKNQIVCSKI